MARKGASMAKIGRALEALFNTLFAESQVLWDKMTLDDFMTELRAIVHGSPDHVTFGMALLKAVKDSGFW